MEQYNSILIIMALTLNAADVTSLQCYKCTINPPNINETKRLCTHFDGSSKYVVECPFSTMCMKQDIYLNIANGGVVKSVERDCAQQTYRYLDYNGKWTEKYEVQDEAYQEGCKTIDSYGEKTTSSKLCFCRQHLCNSSSTSHETYTDIMGVIVVFNLMKYINRLIAQGH